MGSVDNKARKYLFSWWRVLGRCLSQGAAILSKRTDATLLVYRTGKVPRAALRRAKIQIEAVGAHVIGVVLNDLRSDIIGFSSSQYYYGKYYGASGDKEVLAEAPKNGNIFLNLFLKIGLVRVKEEKQA